MTDATREQNDVSFKLSRLAHWLLNDHGFTKAMAAKELAEIARNLSPTMAASALGDATEDVDALRSALDRCRAALSQGEVALEEAKRDRQALIESKVFVIGDGRGNDIWRVSGSQKAYYLPDEALAAYRSLARSSSPSTEDGK